MAHFNNEGFNSEDEDNLSSDDQGPESRLHKAIKLNNIETIAQIVANDPTILGKRDYGYPLHTAVRYNKIEIIDLLFGLNPKILHQHDHLHHSVLHQAVISRSVDAVKKVISLGFTNLDIKSISSETPLYLAATYGYTEIVELLLQLGSNAAIVCCTDNMTPLFAAIRRGHVAVVETLIKTTNTPLNTQDQTGRYLSMMAARFGSVFMIDSLAKLGCDFNRDGLMRLATKREQISVATIEALIRNGNREIERATGLEYLTYGITDDLLYYRVENASGQRVLQIFDPNLQSVGSKLTEDEIVNSRFRAYFNHSLVYRLLYLSYPLGPTDKAIKDMHRAAKRNKSHKIKKLVDLHGPEIIDARRHGSTPLSRAAKKGHMQAIITLVILGSKSIDAYDKNGFTAMHQAAKNGHVHVVEGLIKLGSRSLDENNSNILCQAPIHLAAKFGRLDVVKMLIKFGTTHMNTPDYYGTPPIHHAAHHDQLEIIKLFVEHEGTDILCRKNFNETALHYAIWRNRFRSAKLLLELRHDLIDTPDHMGDTPLHAAVDSGDIRIIKLLLGKGSNAINLKNVDGYTPMQKILDDHFLHDSSIGFPKVDTRLIKILLAFGATIKEFNQLCEQMPSMKSIKIDTEELSQIKTKILAMYSKN
jgi:ankyrin repeat protein